jgi:hypothetical protein
MKGAAIGCFVLAGLTVVTVISIVVEAMKMQEAENTMVIENFLGRYTAMLLVPVV